MNDAAFETETSWGVVVVCVPREADRLEELRAAGIPRLVIVSAGAEPPRGSDDREEWIRFPADAADLGIRIDVLRERVARNAAPTLSDGVLRSGSRWTVLPRTEEKLLAVFLGNFHSVVRTETLAGVFDQRDALEAVRGFVARLRRRIRPLGLTIATVRSQGYMLTYASTV